MTTGTKDASAPAKDAKDAKDKEEEKPAEKKQTVIESKFLIERLC